MRVFAAIGATLFSAAALGQNLVPNGSFEQHDTCPTTPFGYGMYATGWLNLHTTSADYFNACSTDGVVDVPLSQFGYQQAYDGQAYVGMATVLPGAPYYREIVGMELLEPLQPGVPVCLSFRMALGGFGSWYGNSAIYTSKGLGLRFFRVLPSDWQSYLYPNTAAIYLDQVPTDTSQWYVASGTYVPDSAYTYVLVGNFFADTLSEITVLDSSGFGALGGSYAFVDDVRVSFDLDYCDADLAASNASGPAPLVYPQPFQDMLHVRWPTAHATIVERYALLDVRGCLLRSDVPYRPCTDCALPFAGLTSGVYLLRLDLTGGGIATLPVVCVSP